MLVSVNTKPWRMKKVIFPLLSLFFFCGCMPSYPVTDNFNDSYLMHVECTPDVATHNEVLLLLRRARCKEVRTEVVGGMMTVEAAYYKADVAPGIVEEIADNLRLMGTVSFVEIRDNIMVARENH